MNKAELLLLILLINGLFLHLMMIPGGTILLSLSNLMLCLYYILFGFAIFNNIPLKKVFKKESYSEITSNKIILSVITGIVLSLITWTMMFLFLNWPGVFILFFISIISLVLLAIGLFIGYKAHNAPFLIPIFRRLALYGSIIIIMYLIPSSTFIDFRYRKYPEYLEAYHKALANPENEDLWKQVELEEKKIFYGENY